MGRIVGWSIGRHRGTTLNREEAFDQAIKLIADLPCQREVIDFWDMPAVRSDGDRAKWRAAADRLNHHLQVTLADQTLL